MSPPVTAEWIEALLQLPTPERQSSFVQSANLLHEEGLSQLLDHAMELARRDPGQARQLTLICADLAQPAGAPAVLPRATYLRAQTHAIKGEFNTALELIQSARAAYEAMGEKIEALRTNIGLIHVLNELGRHSEALDAGQAVLDALGEQDDAHLQAKLLAALAHQNRGVCFETIGRYDDALTAYAIAEAHYTALKMTERIGDISNDRGIVLTHLGRVSEALEAFETAARIWGEAGLTLLQAQALNNIGEAYLALGHYTRSLNAFEQARRLFDSLEALANQQIVLRKTADAYLALNLYPEALATYREVNELLKHAGMADHRARALWGMGATLVAQAELEEAESVLAEAATLFAEADNIPMLCSVMLEQAALQNAQGDRETALHTAQQALARVTGEQWPVQRVYACLRMADLLLPDTAAAEPHLLEAQRLTHLLNLPAVTYRLHSRLGHLRLLQGHHPSAQTYLEAALTQIETLRGNLAQEAVRTSFLADKTAVYEDLIQLHLVRGDGESIRRAFAVAEQAKSRTLVDLLTGVLPPTHASLDDPVLALRQQRLEADLAVTYNQFLEVAGSPGDTTLSELQSRASHLELDISRLRLRAAGQASAPDPLTIPLAVDTLQAQLPADLLVLAYHIVGDEILAFVHRQGEIRVMRHLSRAEVVQALLQRLNAQWDRFRAGRDFAQRHMAVLLKSAQRVLAALYAELVAPLEAQLTPGAAVAAQVPVGLAIVPHGVLHQVPFHALFDGQGHLLDRFEISYAPSVTVLALCQHRGRQEPKRGLVMGLADAVIPAVNAEAQSVAQQLAEAGVLADGRVGEAATLAALNAVVPGPVALHLACHGLFRADNPMFSALKLHDGWLTAADVMRLDLEDALVTLSACESGRSTVLLGDEVIGLPRAFLGAGAATVVVSLWLVQDETTATLMTQWYKHLSEGVGRAAALREAQRALKEHYAHPYYWAPFILVGRR